MERKLKGKKSSSTVIVSSRGVTRLTMTVLKNLYFPTTRDRSTIIPSPPKCNLIKHRYSIVDVNEKSHFCSARLIILGNESRSSCEVEFKLAGVFV